MADSSSRPDSSGDTGVGPDHESAAGTPRWVRVSWIIGAALVLLFVVLHLTGLSPAGHH